MKNLLIIAILLIGVSINSQAQNEIAAPAPQDGPLYFGEKIDDKGALSPAEFLKEMESGNEIETKLEAKIITCCKKKGCWMDMDLENGSSMKVKFKNYEFFVPKDADGRTAVIQGKAVLETVDVATLQHYAEDAGKSEKEIAAITEPEKAYSFEAVGVIIK